VDRFWFFTWRTHGTWLPGSAGFVGNYVTVYGERRTDNAAGTPTAEPMPRLEEYARDRLKAPPVYLSGEQAGRVALQLHETARYRGRQIDALAVLPDHVHLVFGTPGDPDPDDMLDDWKAYASRALNRLVGWAPPAPRPVWWVVGGSTRILRTPERRAAAVRYVLRQEAPLIVWQSATAVQLLREYPEAPGEPGASATGW
jgi:REP element-mobilizing transposase RayT